MTEQTRARVTTKHEAIDHRQGMTLDELGIFVQEAMRVGHAGSTVVKVRNTIGGRVRALEATSVPGQT